MRTVDEILKEDRLWRVPDVARYLQLSTSWVYRAADNSTLPSLRIGNSLRFDPEAIKTFARGGNRAPEVVAFRKSVSR